MRGRHPQGGREVLRRAREDEGAAQQFRRHRQRREACGFKQAGDNHQRRQPREPGQDIGIEEADRNQDRHLRPAAHGHPFYRLGL
ncbi:MAG: hypothetical protein WC483_01620 [Candidatus Paceibacterota bacterium]